MSVQIATRVFGSELLVALIRHYRANPGLQKEAAAALGVPVQAVSTNTRILVEAGVVVGDPAPRGGRPGRWIVNEDRTLELARELITYTLDNTANLDAPEIGSKETS
ncbi:hypothetical protein GCM10011575_47360 [Microlunatus endophyticus]|uniref:Uncharacterized protein n=2 Tax=Microlunatus endophyticus TaxID=1716077 RepID=A0A917SJJ4_9ACTN|nr:hypothetical protein GCM10011575_47360 [Microlunatus endophyticus]